MTVDEQQEALARIREEIRAAKRAIFNAQDLANHLCRVDPMGTLPGSRSRRDHAAVLEGLVSGARECLEEADRCADAYEARL